MTEEKDSASALAGSESGFDLVCIPCQKRDKYSEAEGYCVDCCEHLCTQCLDYHNVLSAVMYHTLLDKANMPQDQTEPQTKDICTDRCNVHKDKLIEYFCPTHKVLGCSVCITLRHKQCEDVAYIPEVSADLEQSQEYKSFRQRLDELMEQSDRIIKLSKEKKDKSSYLYSKVQQDISAFRQNINTALDELEGELKAKCEQINSQNIVTMETIYSKAKQSLDQVQTLSSDYQELVSKKRYCQAFTKLKTTDLTLLEAKLKQLYDISFSYFKFWPGEELNQMLEVKDSLGKLKVWKSEELIAVSVTNINVSTTDEEDVCKITGIAQLSKDKLVVTDYENETVKLINLIQNKVTSELNLESFPLAVTTTGKDKCAETLPNARKILFLKCDDSLVIGTEIVIEGECWGIAYYQDKLVVTFTDPSKLQILSMTGDVLQSFEKDDQGNQLFVKPTHVSVHPDGPSVFVSDADKNSLTKLGMNGRIQAVYRDDELESPCQCVINEKGHVYLCGIDSENIHLLTTECTKISIIFDETGGLDAPCSVFYCDSTMRLYVGMEARNIKVYQLKTAEEYFCTGW